MSERNWIDDQLAAAAREARNAEITWDDERPTLRELKAEEEENRPDLS